MKMNKIYVSLFAVTLLASCTSVPLPPVVTPTKVHRVTKPAAPIIVPVPIAAPVITNHWKWFH